MSDEEEREKETRARTPLRQDVLQLEQYDSRSEGGKREEWSVREEERKRV